MPPARVALLATICTAFMCCAGAVQLAGVDRLARSERDLGATVSTVADTSGSAAVALRFKSETFPLDR